jgi:uncharacterized protein with PQ loop repeat
MRADWLGWVATVVFLASYSCKSQRTLRLIQALAALLWVVYGLLLHALPIIVANLLVAGVAAYSSRPGITPSVEPDLSRIS